MKMKDLSVAGYPDVTEFDLGGTHRNYIEQFFHDEKTCLTNHVDLYYANFRLMKEIIHNFTQNATRSNCAKLNRMFLSKIKS
jgi:hypothetical protein